MWHFCIITKLIKYGPVYVFFNSWYSLTTHWNSGFLVLQEKQQISSDLLVKNHSGKQWCLCLCGCMCVKRALDLSYHQVCFILGGVQSSFLSSSMFSAYLKAWFFLSEVSVILRAYKCLHNVCVMKTDMQIWKLCYPRNSLESNPDCQILSLAVNTHL